MGTLDHRVGDHVLECLHGRSSSAPEFDSWEAKYMEIKHGFMVEDRAM